MSQPKLMRIDLNTGEHREIPRPTDSMTALYKMCNKLNKTAFIYKLVYYVIGEE